MTKNTSKKKSSAAKKLVPAAGMLAISSMMLASSTYAWFTMSREVEVKGIQMTATVPEDLQLSLGALGSIDGTTYTTETSEKGVSLVASTGVLMKGNEGTTASDGNVLAPVNSWDWSNSANISAYYNFGKLMPASSNNGATIYFTPDASGVGRTVKGDAKFYAANNALAPLKWNSTNKTFDASGDATGSAKATLHAATSKTNDTINDGWKDGGTDNYTVASDWNVTNDDGYYVDIPVWLRSSGSKDINIAVAGYVLPGTTDTTKGKTETELELYRSVRVAILNGDTAKIAGAASDPTIGSITTTNNILPLADAWDKANSTGTGDPKKYTEIKALANPYTQSSILDSGIYDERLGNTGTAAGKLWGVSALTKYATGTDYTTTSETVAPTYTEYTAQAADTAIATVKAPADGSEYGVAKKLIIRVWLDGEDEQCWNDNAGQDWAISLKFSKIS